MKNKLLSILITVCMLFIHTISYSQELTTSYNIIVWNYDFKGQEHMHKLETIGFLPVFQNSRDEITINNITTIRESSLDIQIIEDNLEGIKVLLKYKNKEKEYNKQIVVKNKEKINLNDFKIQIEKK